MSKASKKGCNCRTSSREKSKNATWSLKIFTNFVRSTTLKLLPQFWSNTSIEPCLTLLTGRILQGTKEVRSRFSDSSALIAHVIFLTSAIEGCPCAREQSPCTSVPRTAGDILKPSRKKSLKSTGYNGLRMVLPVIGTRLVQRHWEGRNHAGPDGI